MFSRSRVSRNHPYPHWYPFVCLHFVHNVNLTITSSGCLDGQTGSDFSDQGVYGELKTRPKTCKSQIWKILHFQPLDTCTRASGHLPQIDQNFCHIISRACTATVHA